MSEFPQKKERRRRQEEPDDHSMRTLPWSAEAEKGIICSLMMCAPEVLRMCEDKGLQIEWFNSPVNADLYAAAVAIDRARVPVDLITMTEHLRDVGLLEKCGGGAAVSEYFGYLPTAANAGYYLDILAEKHAARELIRLTNDFGCRVYQEQDRIGDLIDEFQTAALALNRPDASGIDTVKHVKPAVIEAVAAIEETYKHRGGVVGLPSGFHQLDRMTGGMRGPLVIIVAGRPSMGKSALIWEIAEHHALDLGIPSLGFSLEMNSVELAGRGVCKRSRINLQRVRDGFLSQTQMSQTLPAAAMKMASAPLWIDETPGISIQELRVRVRRFIRLHPKVGCVFIDYVQLMTSNTKRGKDNRVMEISEITAGLKSLAKEINRPIIAGAQLNRDNDGANNKPKLSNLRESGSIEQDADWVLLLHRKHYYTKADEDKGKAEVHLAKQRNGPTGDIMLEFDNELGQFRNPPGQDMYSNDPEHRQRPAEDEA